LQATQSSWSSLEISTIVIGPICHCRVQSVLESKECTQSGWKGQRYSKFSSKLKAEISSRSRHRCYSQVIH